MVDWLRQHQELLWWLGAFSVATFVGSILCVPWLIGRIPTHYFAHRNPPVKSRRHPALRLAWRVTRAILGLLLIVAGLAMLVLPGQGILTVLVGLSLLSFPGKFEAERFIVSRGPVLRALNWIRRHRGRPPLVLHDDPEDPGEGGDERTAGNGRPDL